MIILESPQTHEDLSVCVRSHWASGGSRCSDSQASCGRRRARERERPGVTCLDTRRLPCVAKAWPEATRPQVKTHLDGETGGVDSLIPDTAFSRFESQLWCYLWSNLRLYSLINTILHHICWMKSNTCSILILRCWFPKIVSVLLEHVTCSHKT